MSTVLLDLQVASQDTHNLPSQTDFQFWVDSILAAHTEPVEITIRIVDLEESQYLNKTYRHKDKPTNVLSFPFETIPEIDLPLLGDLVICKRVVEDESLLQNKELKSHWAHMVVHGCLHLLGYDHIENPDAEEMEHLETEIMCKMGFSDPYLSEK